MPRPPTNHGLEKKFKSWRKGKSIKSKSGSSSLKNQIRGYERLLGKLLSSDNKDDDSTKRREELKAKIKDLKDQIENKHNVEKERDNASKSHGIRFLERQRLVRMERALLREKKEEQGLKKIAVDQAYVAHFPRDIKYMPLFRKGDRVVDDGKTLRRRAITRNRILQSILKKEERKVKWISKDQYNRVPTTWTMEEEEEMFGKKKEDAKQKKPELPQDDRFKPNVSHQKILQAGEKLQKELKKEDVDDDESSFSGGESDDDDDDDGKVEKLSVGKECRKSSTRFFLILKKKGDQ